MKPIVLSLIIFLCSSILVVADSQNGRFQISAANSIAYFILDTKTGEVFRCTKEKCERYKSPTKKLNKQK